MERRRRFDGGHKPREKVYLDRAALRDRLDAVGLTPEEASERMGFSPKYLAGVLKGGKAVSKRARQALQRVLGRDVAATDVKATLPEGPARRGFTRDDLLGLQFPVFDDHIQGQRAHTALPGYVSRTRLPPALADYFNMGYAALNRRLREQQPLADPDHKKMLRDILTHSKPLQAVGDPLYRGVILTDLRNRASTERDARLRGKEPPAGRPEFRPEFNKGQELSLLSPVSTSTHLQIPLRFSEAAHLDTFAGHSGSVMFELHGAEGKPALVTNETEQEVLLAPGRQLRVLHVEPRVRVPWQGLNNKGVLIPGTDYVVDEWVVGDLE